MVDVEEKLRTCAFKVLLR